MSDFLQILGITIPIFTVIFIGYGAVRFGVLPAGSNEVLGAFALKFAIPAMLFHAISQRQVAEILDGWYLAAYGGGSLLAFAAAYFVTRKLRQGSRAESAVLGMGASFSNNLMIGYPIVLQLFGSAAMVPLTLTLMVENFLMLPLTIILAESSGQGHLDWRKTARLILLRLARNPIIAAIVLGVLFSALELHLPAAANRVIEMFSMTVAGVALFAIGGLLVGVPGRAMLRDVYPVVTVKLILHPLMVLLACGVITATVGVEIHPAAILLACMPIVGIYALIGAQYRPGPECAGAVVISTLCSFLTLSIAIWLIQNTL